MLRPKSMKMKMRMMTMRMSLMRLRIISLRTHIPMTWRICQLAERQMIGGTENWIDGGKWRQVWMPKNRQKSCDSDMQIRTGLEEASVEILQLCQGVYYFPVLMIQASGLYDVRKARRGKLCSPS
jgi:hypothetical protein